MSIIRNGHKITAIYRGTRPIASAIRGSKTLHTSPNPRFSLTLYGNTIKLNDPDGLLQDGYEPKFYRYGYFANRHNHQYHQLFGKEWRIYPWCSIKSNRIARSWPNRSGIDDTTDLTTLISRNIRKNVTRWGYGRTWLLPVDKAGNLRTLVFHMAIGLRKPVYKYNSKGRLVLDRWIDAGRCKFYIVVPAQANATPYISLSNPK